MQTPSKPAGPVILIFFSEQIEEYWSFSLSPPFPWNCKARAIERHSLCCTVFWLTLRKLHNYTGVIFPQWLWHYITASTQPMEISLSSAAKSVHWCICRFTLEKCSDFCARFNNISANQHIPNVYQISFDGHKLCSFRQSVVFVSMVVPKIPSFTFLSTGLTENFKFIAHLRFSNTLSTFWLKVCASSFSMAKLKNQCLPFFISGSTRKFLHVYSSSFKLSSSIILNNFVTSTFLASDTLYSLCTFCLWNRRK